MAIANFIPQVWSARLLENLQQALVFGALCNRNYEGDIAQWGDTVHINILNDITVKPYDPSVSIEDPEQIDGGDATLTIDHGAYYNFYINDVDAVQARADLMDAAMRNAAYRLACDTEEYILGVIRSGAGVKQTVSIPSAADGGLYALLLQVKTAMDNENVPRMNRKLILPPALETELLLDNRFVTGSADAAHRLAEGAVARAAGFDIYISADLDSEIIAMTPEAVTFANQITRVDAYRPEKGFCDGVKGLCLSGAKVLLPDAVCVFTISE
ncbi:MAG: hypothetical protein IJZ74_10720 [Clostridia bacterium]|nr:hypothetical protein [Clostridia bacterium]